MAQHSSSTALQELGCFVTTDDWEVRRFDDPYERIHWDNVLEYDQLVRALPLLQSNPCCCPSVSSVAVASGRNQKSLTWSCLCPC